MKKATTLVFAALFLVLSFAVSDFAQTKSRHYSINHREARQQRRIRQGIKSRELTAQEVYKLEKQQAKLRRTEARYRRSGNGLTWRERYKLQRQLNRTSRTIYRQKHDRQDYNRRP
jgi:Spy/CpxP family protein refolding chaperone